MSYTSDCTGTTGIRIPIVRDDEIGHLASSFNEMSVALQDAG
jgi:HAMP domain-containing protein